MTGSIEQESLDELARQMGGRDALVQVIGMYTAKLPGELEGFRSALQSGDLEAVRTSAHRLKSSSAQLGAKPMAALLADLETAGKQGDADAARRLLDQVETEAVNVMAAMKAIEA